jgi:hypothetical protein
VGHLNRHYSQNTNTNINEILQRASSTMSPLLQWKFLHPNNSLKELNQQKYIYFFCISVTGYHKIGKKRNQNTIQFNTESNRIQTKIFRMCDNSMHNTWLNLKQERNGEYPWRDRKISSHKNEIPTSLSLVCGGGEIHLLWNKIPETCAYKARKK